MRAALMRAANALIDALMCCDDNDFVDEVLSAIVSGIPFEADRIAEETESEVADNG